MYIKSIERRKPMDDVILWHFPEPCQHIDYGDTLTGAICHDCGLTIELMEA